MTLVEILAIGYPQALALEPWGEQGLKYLAWGPTADTHVATALFDPQTLEVACLEIFDPEGVTWVWQPASSTVPVPGTAVDLIKAVNTLAYLMRSSELDLNTDTEDMNDPT